ncbi:phage-like protein [Salmonella bongori]|nr:phage-like protein [Salmonella bongori]
MSEQQRRKPAAYYELVISTDSQGVNATVQVYVSRQPVENLTLTMAGSHGEYPLALTVGSVFSPVKEDGFSFMVGDIYIAQLDYNSDHTVTPHLLGNLTLEPFKVASYEGGPAQQHSR